MLKVGSNLTKMERLQIGLIIALVVGLGILSFAPIKFMEGLVNDAVIVGNNVNTLLLLGGAYLFLQVTFAFLSALSDYIIEKFQAKISAKIQKGLYKKLLVGDFSELMRKDLNDTLNLLVEDINVLSEKSLRPLTKSVLAGVMFIVGIAYIVSISWILAIVIVPFGVITALLNRWTQKKYIKNAEKRKEVSISLWKSFSEQLKGIITIRIFKREEHFKVVVNHQIDQLTDVSLKQSQLEKINYFIASALFMISIGFILTISAIMVVENLITVGAMVAILMYNHMIVDPLISILETRHDAASLNVSYKRIEALLQLKDDLNCKKDRFHVDLIEIENIVFSYSDKVIIDNVSMSINSNDKVAIMGETGSGKSTIVKLIAGLFNPATGYIKYYSKGKQIEGFPTVSYLYQDCYLFDDTIINNIIFANPTIPEETLSNILDKCKVREILDVHGDSLIGESGINLSGGERARIRLAMTLANADASLFIFDELSNSLDDATTKEILENVIEMLNDKICIFIEHNPLVLPCVNKTYKIEKNKVIE